MSLSDEGDSVLRQWEQMHRPPDSIPTSGPRHPPPHHVEHHQVPPQQQVPEVPGGGGSRLAGALMAPAAAAAAAVREPPQHHQRSGSRAGLIVAPGGATGSFRGSGSRRHSVVASSRDAVTTFPLRADGSGGAVSPLAAVAALEAAAANSNSNNNNNLPPHLLHSPPRNPHHRGVSFSKAAKKRKLSDHWGTPSTSKHIFLPYTHLRHVSPFSALEGTNI